MKRTHAQASYLIALIGVVLVEVVASEPCAWVLWLVSESTGSDNEPYARPATPKAAYDNYQKCLKDVRIEAARKVELLKHSRSVKRVRSVPQAGVQYPRTFYTDLISLRVFVEWHEVRPNS
jgi:hypothetical protein